ncbi:MAG: tetratricopeptide repeat protein [Ignavibacteria bacterium]|nr:tetratricopeptide repeat protein [Ignavibacteria bacterium]
MKNKLLILVLIILSGLFLNEAAAQDDTLKIYRKWSLFAEYHKNLDYLTAMPYGWEIIQMDPNRFKTIFLRMEDCIIKMHDSSATSDVQKKEYADTLMYLYDLAIRIQPENVPYFYKNKGYYLETWYSDQELSALAEYEKALQSDPNLDFYYVDRIGLLYMKYASDGNDFKLKALELYQNASVKDPNNPIPIERLKNLAEDVTQLIEITYQAWQLDKENLAKAWQYASITFQSGEYEKAIEPLEFLSKKTPDSETYWNRLGTAYQKLEKYNLAIETYKKAFELNSKTKEYPLNIGICYKELGQLSTARTFFYKAAEVGNGWGLPYIYEATLYQTAVQKCGSFEFMDKIVLKLAQEIYMKARSVDPNVTAMANEAISNLNSSVPTKEEYFFRKYRSGQTIKIEGNCYNWIGRSVTVP